MSRDMNLDEEGTLACYRHLVVLNEKMLGAARNANWELVTDYEEQCARVIDELKVLKERTQEHSAFKQEKMRLIRQILAIDADIRDLAQPKLVQLENAMRAPRVARRLSAAYGCGRFEF
jgi:flagellar protein FliT